MTRTLGDAGEEAALRDLVEAGMVVVDRRVRSRVGEIDLVVLDGPTVVFVEVKTRSARGFGHPGEAVTRDKRRRLARLASMFLARRGWGERPCRFDVVEVEPHGGSLRTHHIPDAFRPGD